MIRLLILLFIPQLLLAGTAKILIREQLKQISNISNTNKDSSLSCHSSKKKELMPILPYPTNLDDALEKIEEVEAICTVAENQSKARDEVIKAVDTIVKDYKKKFKKYSFKTHKDYKFNSIGQITNDSESNPLLKGDFLGKDVKKKLETIQYYNGSSDNDLKQKVLAHYPKGNNQFYKIKDNKKKCEYLKVAYMEATWNLTLMKPSFDYKTNTIDDLILSMKPELDEFKNFEKDKLRASWALRNFVTLDKKDIPTDCKNKAGRSFYDEAMHRFNSISEPTVQRKPLGFALGMCGRSMTGHCFDDIEPTRPEFELCFSASHRKALIDGDILGK